MLIKLELELVRIANCKRFLFPGIGYGGSCFPKDVQALVKSGKENLFEFEILNAVMKVNEDQKTVLYPKIKNFFRGDLKERKLQCGA
jgi:UDPglucose 6-dehydrogenase